MFTVPPNVWLGNQQSYDFSEWSSDFSGESHDHCRPSHDHRQQSHGHTQLSRDQSELSSDEQRLSCDHQWQSSDSETKIKKEKPCISSDNKYKIHVTKKSDSDTGELPACGQGGYHSMSDGEDNHDTYDNQSEVNSTASLFLTDSDNVTNICNTFWRPMLTFHPYRHGCNMTVEFKAIWPDETFLSEVIMEAVYSTVLRKAVLELCKLVLRCGPVRVLRLLIELKIIDIEQIFEDGCSMLHLACIARNFDAVLYLTSLRAHKTRDKYGRTADQVCFCPKIKKLIPWARSLNTPVKDRPLKRPSMQDRETMFELAKDSKHFDELQVKLQSLDFDVNQESSSKGDYMVHIAAKEGLRQMPLLLSLVKIQNADIEQTNSKGMTPLMIAADAGNAVLTDVLICILGANPNTPNPENGQTALHYGAAKNNIDVVNCLIKRGADCNLDDKNGCRPDDLAPSDVTDSYEIVKVHREQRIAYLSELVQTGELFESDIQVTDLFNVDKNGNTLIMNAAAANRCENLEVLIEREGCPINGQHHRHGRTALSIAVIEESQEAVQLLLCNDADPSIKDIGGRLPLHYAVSANNLVMVDTLLSYDGSLTGLGLALKSSKSSAVHAKIKEALERRQQKIVNPTLFECSVTGNAGKLFCFLEEEDNVNPTMGGGDWPIYLAAENGHLEVIKLLHQYGGDICRQHSASLNTPLHVACSRGHMDIARFLIQHTRRGRARQRNDRVKSSGRCVDINAMNADSKTPLQLAADKGYRQIVRLLLNHGATAAILDSDLQLFTCPYFQGVQVLIENHRRNQLQLIQRLIVAKKGLTELKKIWQPRFDHNLRDSHGDTPLMIACHAGKADVVKFLLESAVYIFDPHVMQGRHRSSSSSADSGLSDLAPAGVPHISEVSDNDTVLEASCNMDCNTPRHSKCDESKGQRSTNGTRTRVSPFSSGNFFTRKLRRSLSHLAETPVGNQESDSTTEYLSDEKTKSLRKLSDGERFEESTEEEDARYSFATASCAVTNKEKKSRFFSFLRKDPLQPLHESQSRQYYQPNIANSHSILCAGSTPADHQVNSVLSTYSDVPHSGTSTPPSSHNTSPAVRKNSDLMKTRSDMEIIRTSSARRRLNLESDGTNRQTPPARAQQEASWEDSTCRTDSVINQMARAGINHFVQGNKISHVCSINPIDGATALHRAVEAGDLVDIVTLLLEADYTCVNVQNIHGLTALHQAVKLRRKKTVEKLTALQYVDLNLRTLDGKLPEEMTPNKYLVSLVKNARDIYIPQMSPISSLLGSLDSNHEEGYSQAGGSSVDFDKLNTRFVTMKRSVLYQPVTLEEYSM